MEDYWNWNCFMYPTDSFAVIHQPLRGTSYLSLFQQLLDHPHADELAVKDATRWIHLYKRRVTPEGLERAAYRAQQARCKNDQFKVRFKLSTSWEKENRSVISFIERESELISYHITVPSKHRSLFTIRNISNEDSYINALWVPS